MFVILSVLLTKIFIFCNSYKYRRSGYDYYRRQDISAF